MGFERLTLQEANYGQLGALTPKEHSHTYTQACRRPPETAALRVWAPAGSSFSHEVWQCGWMWFRYWKKKKKWRQRNGLPPDGCDKCQRDWFISRRLFRAPTTTTVINAAARDWCNCYAAIMNWPGATMRPGAAPFSHTRDTGTREGLRVSLPHIHEKLNESLLFIYCRTNEISCCRDSTVSWPAGI